MNIINSFTQPITNKLDDIGTWNNALEARVMDEDTPPSYKDLAVGLVTLTFKDVMHTIFSVCANTAALLTLGCSAKINDRAKLYEVSEAYNALGKLHWIFLQAVTSNPVKNESDGEFDDATKTRYQPFELGFSGFYKKTTERLKSKNFAERELLTRVLFLGEGLCVVAGKIGLTALGIIAGVGSILSTAVTKRGYEPLNAFASLALYSSNSIHTALLALRHFVNPHVFHPDVRPPISDVVGVERPDTPIPTSRHVFYVGNTIFANREIAEGYCRKNQINFSEITKVLDDSNTSENDLEFVFYVGEYVFPSREAAEDYCHKHNIDYSEIIEDQD